jgi:hypothetical protein
LSLFTVACAIAQRACISDRPLDHLRSCEQRNRVESDLRRHRQFPIGSAAR